MADNDFVKAEQVLAQMLGLLERDTVLAQFTWRDPKIDASYKGAKDDTVTLAVPAFTTARTRVMRGGQPIIIDKLTETKVDVKLDTHVYKAIGISDEEMTLDIKDFGEQVTAPAMGSVVRKVDDAVG
ncbi:MAG: P22 phage major capsid protein family protein, partial [Acidimicrobiales bacterium]|nr:P22 phage major capsid protein family protein [Acidimicrobiales bacterium]